MKTVNFLLILLIPKLIISLDCYAMNNQEKAHDDSTLLTKPYKKLPLKLKYLCLNSILENPQKDPARYLYIKNGKGVFFICRNIINQKMHDFPNLSGIDSLFKLITVAQNLKLSHEEKNVKEELHERMKKASFEEKKKFFDSK